jgi:DNA sulfur modification protein DndE
MVAIENVRINIEGKERLSRLKKFTGLQNWNVLCRWALCRSLSDPTVPPKIDVKGETGVEMTWKVFGGEYQEVYLALLKQRCRKDGFALDDIIISDQLWLHLHRGLNFLTSDSLVKEAYRSGRRSVRGLLEISNNSNKAA